MHILKFTFVKPAFSKKWCFTDLSNLELSLFDFCYSSPVQKTAVNS